MATAKAGPRRTSRKVTLSLTEGEADFILGVAAQMGGHPARSPRKYAKRVRSALEAALGYDFSQTDAYNLGLGAIEFRDYGSDMVTDEERVLDYLGLPQEEFVVTYA